MGINKLWTRLFTKNNQNDDISLHIAGATIRHENPFLKIDIPRNDEELTDEFVKKWVMPFYMNGFSDLDKATLKSFADAALKIDIDIVEQLLGDFDWRPRIVGAYFAAINQYSELEVIIGNNLLKSEVCYAGLGYCLALANFGTEKAKSYLARYLDYYLERSDLWFDQDSAFCALEFLDSRESSLFIAKWESFVSAQGYGDLEKSRSLFMRNMASIDEIRHLSKGINHK